VRLLVGLKEEIKTLKEGIKDARIIDARLNCKGYADAEVTPAMIAAGRAELASFNDEYESAEGAVERIYRAMRAAVVTGQR